MTELLERPDLDLPAVLWATHTHTVQCWWHPELAAWVCRPSGDGST